MTAPQLTPAQLATLKTELGLAAYSGKTNLECVELLNAKTAGNIEDRTVLPSYLVAAAIAWGDYNAAGVNATMRQYIQTIIAAGFVDVSSPAVRAAFSAIFPVGSATRTALLDLTKRPASRAEFLFSVAGIVVYEHDVQRAKDLP